MYKEMTMTDKEIMELMNENYEKMNKSNQKMMTSFYDKFDKYALANEGSHKAIVETQNILAKEVVEVRTRSEGVISQLRNLRWLIGLGLTATALGISMLKILG